MNPVKASVYILEGLDRDSTILENGIKKVTWI
jgi:hypothetical protein